MTTVLVRYVHFMRLCFAVWASFHPAAPMQRHALEVADAIAYANLFDSNPVFPIDTQVAVQARSAVEESWLQPHALGDGGKSKGYFQMQSPAGLAEPRVQASAWLALLHRVAVDCPSDPIAILSSGRCDRGHVLSRRRMNAVASLLQQASDGRVQN